MERWLPILPTPSSPGQRGCTTLIWLLLRSEAINHIVHSGMNLEKFHNAEPADLPCETPVQLITIVGSLEPPKRHGEFLDVLPECASSGGRPGICGWARRCIPRLFGMMSNAGLPPPISACCLLCARVCRGWWYNV